MKNKTLILSALWAAKLWNDSIADAHYYSIPEGHRSKENTKVAMDAIKLSNRYEKLHDKLRKEQK